MNKDKITISDHISFWILAITVIGIFITGIYQLFDSIVNPSNSYTTEECKLISLRVDDDAEYHITIQTANKLESFSDCNSTIRYSQTTYEPVVYIRKYQGVYMESSILIMLPLNYKIDTFDD